MKERLTGAIILVALMVLLVPELLTGPIRTKSLPDAAATAGSSPPVAAGPASQAQPPLRTYTLTLGPTPSARGSAAVPAVQGPAAQPPASQQQSPGGAPAISPQSAAPKRAQSAAAKPSGAVAQAPEHAQARPRAAAAPQHALAHAQPARAPGRSAPSHPGLQVAKPPAHQVVRKAASAASSGGWVVQLGVFAERVNAIRLASRLEHRGFRISVARMRVRSRVLWRVSTAPPQRRAAALHLAARLRAAGHRGDVLPAR